MTDDRGTIRSIAWRDLFPWLLIFRTFWLSLSLPLLFLATAGVLLQPIGWRLADAIFISDETLRERGDFAAVNEGLTRFPSRNYTPSSQIAHNHFERSLVRFFQRASNRLMQRFTLVFQQALVCDFLGQHVFEPVDRIRHDANLLDDSCALQSVERRALFCSTHRLAENASREFPSNDRRHSQRFPAFRRQTIDARPNHRLYAVGQVQRLGRFLHDGFVAPGRPVLAGAAGEQLDERAGRAGFDDPVLLVRLARVLALAR